MIATVHFLRRPANYTVAHQRYRQTGLTDRRSDSIGQTVLQTVARKTADRRIRHDVELCRAVSSQLRHVSTIGKKLANNDTSSTCPDMVNFGLLTAEICWRVWGTPANFNGFRVLAALQHDTLVVRLS